jgi:hypothetical protein
MMKLSLNVDKSAFCTIGQLAFTYGEPGPVDIDPTQLSEAEARQVVFNVKRGVLLADDLSPLESLLDMQPQAPQQQEQKVVRVQPPTIDEAIERDNKELKKLLSKNASTVKKEAAQMRPARLRRLLGLEEEGKNRKGVVSFINELLKGHTDTVAKSIGLDDLQAQDMVKVTELSTQLTDIVESEMEEVTFNLPEESEED